VTRTEAWSSLVAILSVTYDSDEIIRNVGESVHSTLDVDIVD